MTTTAGLSFVSYHCKQSLFKLLYKFFYSREREREREREGASGCRVAAREGEINSDRGRTVADRTGLRGAHAPLDYAPACAWVDVWREGVRGLRGLRGGGEASARDFILCFPVPSAASTATFFDFSLFSPD
jgi:hypothetical protein